MGESVSIRRAAAADLAAVTALLARQFDEHGIALTPSRLEAAVSGMLAEESRGLILAAEAKGSIVGVAVLSLIWTLEHGGRSAWLDELYVAADLRGRGIGKALLRGAIEEAQRLGCAAVDLEVERSHRRAEGLYRRRGFRRHSRSRWVLPL